MAHLKLNAGLKVKAADAPANGKPAGRTRRFSMVAYTGGKMSLEGFDLPVVVDLTGLTVHSQTRPILADHTPSRENVAGQSDRIVVVDNQLLIDGVIFAGRPCGKDIASLADDGFAWQASIGADIPSDDDLEEVAAGQSVEVNGQTATGPCYIARRTVLGETSFVVMGADDRTSARIAARRRKARAAARSVKARSAKGSAMSFEDYVRSLGLDPATLSPDQLAAFQLAYEASGEGEADTVAGEGDEDDRLEGEGDDEDLNAEGDDEDVQASGDNEETPPAAKSRRAAAGRHGGGKSRVRAAARRPISAFAQKRAKEVRRVNAVEAACAGHPKILARALEESWSIDRANLEVLRASRAVAPKPARGGPGDMHSNSQVIEASLLMSVGIKAEKAAKWYGEKVVDQATSREMRGVSLHYAMDRVIEASGEHFRGNRKSNSFINATIRAERKIRASTGFSTLSLSTLLENVANKALIDAYESVETVWQMVCAIRNHADFKVHNRYRLDSKGAFQPVSQAGELKHISLENAKYTNQVDTFGAIISLTRKMQIDDDLQAFLQLPQILGRLGKLAPEEEFFKLLLANAASFFHANNRNLQTGAGSALDIAGLTLMETAFANQIDSNKKPILTPPAVMLVGSALKTTADQLYADTTVVATTTANKPITNSNPHKGKYKPVSSPYPNNTAILDRDGAALTGQSATKWWMFCDPSVRAAFGMAFLNGQQMPTVESDEAAFDTLGYQWRAYLDFGVGTEDPSAAQQANGA